MNETQWQEQFLQLAHLLGWRHLHVRRTIGKGHKWVTSTNVKGWPDLFLWHERDRRVLAVELKVKPNVATVEQVEVLASLALAGVETHVLYPEQLDEAKSILQRQI